MANYRGVWRACLWRCVCVCLLFASVNVDAATRKYVAASKISSKTVVSGGTASGTSDAIDVTGAALEGEYIAAETKNVPVRGIHGGITSGYRTVSTGLKGALKANLGQMLLQATVAAAVAGVGWVMSDDNTKLQKTKPQVDGVDASTSATSFHPQNICVTLPASSTVGKITIDTYNGVTYAIAVFPYQTLPSGYTLYLNNCTSSSLGYTTNAQAKWPQSAARVISVSDVVSLKTDLSDSDWNALDPWLATQSAAWLTDMMRQICGGSYGTLSPDQCFDSMKTASKNLTGPASVDGGTKTTTSTYTKADGTTGTKSQTVQTTYNITNYGPDYYDYSKTEKTVNYQDGTKTDESTSSEDPNVTEETPSEEDDQQSSSPCSTNCDGPAYTDLYTPTTDTKEQALDSYVSRVKALPIVAATTGFFNVSVSAACPVWQSASSMDIMGYSFVWDLKFDYHCQAWFIDYQPFAALVVLLLAAWGAFYIAMLD